MSPRISTELVAEEIDFLIAFAEAIYCSGDGPATEDAKRPRTTRDLRAKGVHVAEPCDPMHDSEFIRALIATYRIAPTTDWIMQTWHEFSRAIERGTPHDCP